MKEHNKDENEVDGGGDISNVSCEPQLACTPLSHGEPRGRYVNLTQCGVCIL